MKDYMEQRIKDEAKYIIKSKATIRNIAKIFGASKSTVHIDMTQRLPKLNPQIAKQVRNILMYNKAERHIRGGNATKMRYKNINN